MAAAPFTVGAQTKKGPHIGFLAAAELTNVYIDEFRQGLRDLGYVEGRTIAIDVRWPRGSRELSELAAEFVALQVDVIVTSGDAPVRAAMNVTRTIPIVMAISGDPVGSGYVASLRSPGGNVTGLTALSPELAAKQLEVLKDAIPNVTRIALVWNAANPVKALDVEATHRAAKMLGLVIQAKPVRTIADFDAAFAAIARERPDAVLALPDDFIVQTNSRKRIREFGLTNHLPTILGRRVFVEEGGLLSYAPSVQAMFHRAAYYVDKILKGAKPADLPVEQPTKFELVINLKTAKALGLTIPQSLLVRADEIIE
jgi:putative tryptophan/tyrosine transport system substrate-binding protein